MTAPIYTTGARVSRITEEGEVTLFCYSIQRDISLQVSRNETKAWASRIGDYVTVQVLPEKLAEAMR